MAVQKLFWIFAVIQFFNSGNALQFTNLPATVSVTVGTTGEIFKARTDAPQGSIVFYLVPPSPASTYFYMEQSSGAVSVKSGVTLQPGTYTFTDIIPLIIPAIRGPAETLTIQVSDSAPPPSLFSQETYLAFPNSNTVNTQVFGPAINFVTNPSPASTIIYSLDTTTNSQYFSVNPSTGNIVLSQNYNVAALGDGVTLVLRATSTEGYVDTANIVVKIPNVSNLPAIPNLPNVIEVPENSPINSLIYTVNPPAVNGIPVIVTFTMTQSPATPSNLFSINPSTGQITTSAEIDYETVTTKTFMLEITVTDFSDKSSMSTLTVSVLDVNEPPMLTPTSYDITTTPGPIGQTIVPETILSAVVDPDANDATSLQLLGDINSQYFTLNPTTGEISYVIDNSLNTIPSPVKLRVLVTDKEFAYIIVNFNIIIETSSNVSPSFSNLPQTITIPQSQTAGLTFFTAIASDPDSTGPLTYSLPPTSPENLFNIDPTNGALSLKFSDTLAGLSSPATIDITVSDGTDVTTGTLILTVSTNPMLSNLPATVTIPVTQAPGVKFFTLSATNPNGNSLFYFLDPSSNPQNMFLVDFSSGDISVGFGNSLSSLPLTTTSVDLKVAVADGNKAVNDVLTIIIDRNTSNTAPIFTNLPTTKMIPNSTPQNIVVFTAVASDPGDSLTYSLGGPHAAFFTINPDTGVITTVTPMSGFRATTDLNLEVTVTDGLLSTTQPITITVSPTPINVAPVINNLPTTKQTIINTTPIGTSVFTVNATDSNGDVTYSLNGPGSSAFFINSNSGEITTTFDFTQISIPTDVNLEVTVTDGLLSTTQPITITITPTPINVAPVINNLPTTKQTIINTTPIGTSVFTVNATDSNGDVTYSLSGPGSSAFFINSNSGEITTTFDFTQISIPTDVNLEVTVTDGLLSTTQPITITITPTPINVAPVINNLPTTKQTIINTTPIGTSVFTVNATDSNGDVTYSLSGPGSSAFFINSNSGEITTTFDFTQISIPTDVNLEVTVTDGLLSTTQPITITITPTPINVAPVINNLPTTKQTIINTTPIGTSVFTVNATDSNGDVTYSLSGPGSSAFFINSNSGEITTTFDFTQISIPTDVNLEVTVTDGLLSTTQPITITITPTPINVAPVINNLPTTKQTIINTTPIGTSVFTVNATDSNGDVTYSLSGPGSSAFFINSNSGEITTTFDFTQISIPTDVNLEVTVTDGLLSTTQPITITITPTPINVAPVINNLPTTKQTIINTTPIGTSVFTVNATDSNGDVTYSLSGPGSSAFFINSNSGEITTTFDFTQISIPTDVNLEVTVTDGLLSTTQPITITITPTPINVAPVINNLPTTKQTIINTTPIGTSVFTVNATDSNGDVTYSLSGPGSSAFFINSNSGEITTKFDFTQISIPTDVNLEVTVTDGLLSTTQPITITITPTPINVAPVINNLPTTKQTIINTTPIGTSVFTVDATDSDGDVLTYSLGGFGALFFDINPNTGVITTVTPMSGFRATTDLNLEVTVTDGLLSTTQLITITISPTPINVAPVINNLPTTKQTIINTTPIGTSVFTVDATDSDGDVLTYSLGGFDALFFDINPNNGQITLKSPVTSSTGSNLQVSVDVSDGKDTVSEQLTVSVVDTTSGLVFSNVPEYKVISRYTTEGKTIYTVVAIDTNQTGSIVYSMPSDAKFAIDSNTGEVTVKPGANLASLPLGNIPFALNISVTDGIQTATAELTVVVF